MLLGPNTEREHNYCLVVIGNFQGLNHVLEFPKIAYSEWEDYLFFEKNKIDRTGKTSGRGRGKLKPPAHIATGSMKKTKIVLVSNEEEVDLKSFLLRGFLEMSRRLRQGMMLQPLLQLTRTLIGGGGAKRLV